MLHIIPILALAWGLFQFLEPTRDRTQRRHRRSRFGLGARTRVRVCRSGSAMG